MDTENAEVKAILEEHFKALPAPVQNAILSADVEKHLRELASKHKLHFDQWISLENEVMMALLGIQPVEKLGQNIAEEAEISPELGEQIADDAFEIVFEPIRKKLEQELDNPNAGEPETSPAGQARQAAIAEAKETDEPTQQAPKEAPRSALNDSSAKRKAIVGDPYRESVV